MQTIFIQVKCELGRAYEVADEAVLGVDQVSEVHSISGLSFETTAPLSPQDEACESKDAGSSA